MIINILAALLIASSYQFGPWRSNFELGAAPLTPTRLKAFIIANIEQESGSVLDNGNIKKAANLLLERNPRDPLARVYAPLSAYNDGDFEKFAEQIIPLAASNPVTFRSVLPMLANLLLNSEARTHMRVYLEDSSSLLGQNLSMGMAEYEPQALLEEPDVMRAQHQAFKRVLQKTVKNSGHQQAYNLFCKVQLYQGKCPYGTIDADLKEIDTFPPFGWKSHLNVSVGPSGDVEVLVTKTVPQLILTQNFYVDSNTDHLVLKTNFITQEGKLRLTARLKCIQGNDIVWQRELEEGITGHQIYSDSFSAKTPCTFYEIKFFAALISGRQQLSILKLLSLNIQAGLQ